ncbi:ADAM protease ADM-B [Metarhizium album ARSEF 1941]|uniref:Disintegrin and metalloproteinase domain-containing protein B n=1 Tax=Metarhizium album (strain ARSEF 1941) TaxID=1081103 RepID=A0A0B2X6H9_METAS|nr:ADAM protease ADM-B [Metarhizium album ARSEF 1941]KHO01999.1 ADAM protease ADM-B [Metarhizium album ARSEF 1941]
MVSLQFIVTVVTSAALLAPSSLAHSVKRNPVSVISLVHDPVIKTPSHRVHAFSKFDITFSLHHGQHQQKIRLALEPNHDVLHEDFSITHLSEDGSVREVKKVPRLEDRVYRGDAFIERPGTSGWSKAGWARVTVHEDGEKPIFHGAFRIDGDNHHVLPRSDYQSIKDERDPLVDASANDQVMVVWRDSDVMDHHDGHGELKRHLADSSKCNADALEFNRQLRPESLELRSTSFSSLFGRQIDGNGGGTGLNLLDSIGSSAGCPTTKKVALVGIATDCNYFSAFNNTNAIKRQVIGVVNSASELYESTFKISLAIRNLTVIDRGCAGASTTANTQWNVECSDGVTITDRLNTFSKWRAGSKDDNAFWSLFTTCATDTAVGLAWRGMLCRAGASGEGDGAKNETVAATNVVVKTATEWQIFAHETGHTFGAVHDCVSQTCPANGPSQACCPLSKDQCNAGGKYIMNPSTGNGVTAFSPCSIGNICSGLKSNQIKGSCLTDNKNVQTDVNIGSQCGNGIVEAGEDCDCGGEAGCNGNKCCDPKTCKFTSGSVCDPSNEDCCTDQCKFASSGIVCRPSTGECDIQETCPGDKAACPADKHKSNGDSCGNGLQCASGQCTSPDLQCQHMANSLTGRNNTKACPETECMLACTSPDLPSNQCITYNQFFVDGTSCGAGGHCLNGNCQGSSTLKEIGQWIDRHKAIFIPVVCVVGLLIVIVIASCTTSSIRRCVMKRRTGRPQAAPGMNGWPSSSYGEQQQWGGVRGGWNGPRPTESSGALFPSGPQHQHQQQQSGFYDAPPYPPAPAAANADGRWRNQGGMRYM